MNLGIWLFAAAVAFQVVTLPVEFNASSRAVKMLVARGYIDKDEVSADPSRPQRGRADLCGCRGRRGDAMLRV